MRKRLLCPVSGTLRQVLVAVGDVVTAQTEVAIVESMKMEIPVLAEQAGRVAAVYAQADEPIEEGAVLIEFGS